MISLYQSLVPHYSDSNALSQTFSARLKDNLEAQLIAEGTTDSEAVAAFAQTILDGLATQDPSNYRPFPIRQDQLKAMVFPHDNQHEIYIYKAKTKNCSTTQQRPVNTPRKSKELSKAVRIIVPKSSDQELKVEKAARLLLDLTPASPHDHPEAAFHREVKILNALKGVDEISQLYASAIYQGSKGGKPCTKGVMFQKFYSRGDLEGYLKHAKAGNEAVLYHRLLKALAILHEKKIMHNDIKPKNIFIDETFKIVFGDVEFALTEEDKDTPEVMEKYLKSGSYPHLSPERFRYLCNPKLGTDAVGLPSDIWALGTILYYLHHRKWPKIAYLLDSFFTCAERIKQLDHQMRMNKTLSAIEKREYDQMMAVLEEHLIAIEKTFDEMSASAAKIQHPHTLDDLITQLLDPDPERRLTAQQAYLTICKNTSLVPHVNGTVNRFITSNAVSAA